MLSDLPVLILAGGLGTRLSSVLGGQPKILAPIDGRPFVEYLLAWLEAQGVRNVIFSLGHLAERVQAHLGSRVVGLQKIVSVVEPEPLGTAGAVAFSLRHLPRRPILIINGDTFVDVSLEALWSSHQAHGDIASIVCAQVDNAGRFGQVEIDATNRIVRFEEKSSAPGGLAWVNAGVYCFDPLMLDQIALRQRGSLEKDILQLMPPRSIRAYCTRGRFLDIGTPESLAQAADLMREDHKTESKAGPHDH